MKIFVVVESVDSCFGWEDIHDLYFTKLEKAQKRLDKLKKKDKSRIYSIKEINVGE